MSVLRSRVWVAERVWMELVDLRVAVRRGGGALGVKWVRRVRFIIFYFSRSNLFLFYLQFSPIRPRSARTLRTQLP